MLKGKSRILKFVFRIGLAILLFSAVYNYFPNFVSLAKETGFFLASLAQGIEQKIENQQQKKIPILNSDLKAGIEITSLSDSNEEENKEDEAVLQNEMSYQDKLDEIAEQIDLIRRQIADLTGENSKSQIPNSKQIINPNNQKDEDDNENKDESEAKEENEEPENLENPAVILVNSGVKTIYPKILISEIEIAGADNDKQEFVELYNPNHQDVDLTDWYLQRKTKTADYYSTYASSNLFSGKKISAKSYFIIAREGNFSLSQADIWTDNPLTEDNSLILKDPNRDIVNKVGWGNVTDFEGIVAPNPPESLSIGRKWEGDERESGNNFLDFEIQNLTPGAQNVKYTESALPPAVPLEIESKKVLINEIYFSEDNKFFIELFNPSDAEIDLTGWYLQRKTATGSDYSSFITKMQLENKKIGAKNYFLIAREGSDFAESADVVIDDPLTENNSLVLKNSTGDISDKLGFGSATDFEILASVSPEDEKSLGRKWIFSATSSQDTDNNFLDFEIQAPTPKAQNILFFEPPPAEPEDITPPTVVFNLTEIQTELSFTINFEITDILETTSSGVASYVFRWSEDNENWQEYAEKIVEGQPEKFSAPENFSGQDQKVYYFQIKAKDSSGNESLWLPETPAQTKIELPPPPPPPPPPPAELLAIVINEIQTGGQITKDEFIELFNPNNQEIDLVNFSLKKKTSSGAESNLVSSGSFTGIIQALGYFLIAPQDNDDGSVNYTGSVAPDLRYSGKSYSVADNNTILLYDKEGNLQDKVGFGTAVDFENSSVQNPPSGKSISRTQGIDTNDNSADFTIKDPTPKTE